MELGKKLKDEVWDYCRVNDITNINEFMIKIFKSGFTSEKYGSQPGSGKVQIKEKVVEKIVEKEVFVTNDVEVKKLTDKIKSLDAELIKVKEELKIEKDNNRLDIYGDVK